MKLQTVQVKDIRKDNKFNLYMDQVFDEKIRAEKCMEDESHKPYEVLVDGSLILREGKEKGKLVYDVVVGHVLLKNVTSKTKTIKAQVYIQKELPDHSAFQLIFNKDRQSSYAKFSQYERAFAVSKLMNDHTKQYSKAQLARWNGVEPNTLTNWNDGVKMFQRVENLMGLKKIKGKTQWTHFKDLGVLAKKIKNKLSDKEIVSLMEKVINNKLKTDTFKEVLRAVESSYKSVVSKKNKNNVVNMKDNKKLKKNIETILDKAKSKKTKITQDKFSIYVKKTISVSPLKEKINFSCNRDQTFNIELKKLTLGDLQNAEELMTDIKRLGANTFTVPIPISKAKTRKAA